MRIEEFLGAAFFIFLCWLSVTMLLFSWQSEHDYLCEHGALTSVVYTSEIELHRDQPYFIRVWSQDGRELFVNRESVGTCSRSETRVT